MRAGLSSMKGRLTGRSPVGEPSGSEVVASPFGGCTLPQWADTDSEKGLLYFERIMGYLREREVRYTTLSVHSCQVLSGFTLHSRANMGELLLRRQGRHYEAAMRSVLVEWLFDLQVEYHLKHETLACAVQFCDRMLCSVRFKKNELQLMGATAMMIAAKTLEIRPPPLKEWVWICDGQYTEHQILLCERLILQTIDFDVHCVTHVDFLDPWIYLVCQNEEPLEVALEGDEEDEEEEKKETSEPPIKHTRPMRPFARSVAEFAVCSFFLEENFGDYRPSEISFAVLVLLSAYQIPPFHSGRPNREQRRSSETDSSGSSSSTMEEAAIKADRGWDIVLKLMFSLGFESDGKQKSKREDGGSSRASGVAESTESERRERTEEKKESDEPREPSLISQITGTSEGCIDVLRLHSLCWQIHRAFSTVLQTRDKHPYPGLFRKFNLSSDKGCSSKKESECIEESLAKSPMLDPRWISQEGGQCLLGSSDFHCLLRNVLTDVMPTAPDLRSDASLSPPTISRSTKTSLSSTHDDKIPRTRRMSLETFLSRP